MSWFDLRNRSPDPNAALLRDLIQAKIDAEIQAHEPEDTEHLEIGIESYSNVNIDDSLSWSFLRDTTLGYTDRNYIPKEPDLNSLRLWIKNENGGHILKDHSKMGNIVNIFGHHPPRMLKIGDQDGLTGNRLCNIYDGNVAASPVLPAGGQFMRISDNPNVRIQELTSGDSITFFVRLYPIMPPANTNYMVLWSKIDNEQVTDGYLATIDQAGYVTFTVRKANKTRSIRMAEPLTYLMLEEVTAAFQPAHYQPAFFRTETRTLADLPLPSPIPFVDLCVTCKFSDMSMSIIRDGVPVASTATLAGTSLVGHWPLNEGGNIGTTVQEQTPSQRTAYNNYAGGNNGTISNAVWLVPDANKPQERFLSFDGNADFVSVTNYSAIQNLSSGTVSFWYRHDGDVSVVRRLVYKGTVGSANTWAVEVGTNGRVSFVARNSGNTAFTTSPTTVLAAGAWYHIVAKWTLGSLARVTINGTHTTGTTPTGTMDTGSTAMVVGQNSVNCVKGYMSDLKVYNTTLSDTDVVSLYTEGQTGSVSFPAWQANPPIPDESPDPITNPFSRYYNVPWDPTAANRDTTKLHARIISGFTNFYDTNDGTDITGSSQNIPYAAIYDVQPSGGGGGGTPVTVYDVAIGSGQHLEFEGGVVRGGIQILTGHTAIGKALRSVTVKYRIINGGTITVGVRKASDGTLVTLGTFSAAGSGEQSATVNGTPSYAMVANDIISVEGATDSIELTQNPSVSDPANTTSLEYAGSWGATGYTIAMTVTAAIPGSAGYTLWQNLPNPPWAANVNNRAAAYISSASYNQLGKKITKIVVSMSKTGSPGGTITAKIFKAGSTSNTVTIGTSKAASDIPAVQGNVTFEWGTEAERKAQTYALANGDRIGIEITGTSASDTNYYTVHHNETSSLANIYASYYRTSGQTGVGWNADNTAYEMVGQFYTGGYTDVLPAVVAHIKLDHATIRAAEKFATSSAGIGKAITRISPRFQKFGNPTGSVSVVIRNSSGTLMSSFGTIDAVADIPVGAVWTLKDFTNLTNSRTCAANDVVSIEYGSGDANNYVMVSMNLNTDNYDASLSYAQTWPAGGSAYANAGGGTTYDIAGTMATGGIATDPLGRTRAGQRCNAPTSVMRGKKVTRAIVYLHKVGTPPAATPVTIRIRKEGTDAIAAEIGSIMATALTTSAAAYTFENVNNVYVTQQNDILSIEYDYGDDSNYVMVNRSKVDIYETTGNLSQVVDFNAPVYNALTSDLYGELWTGGDTYTPAVDEQSIRDPYYHHDLLIGAGGWDWSYYAAVGTIGNHAFINFMPEFRLYRQELTAQQALNLFTNRCTISDIPFGKVAKVGTFGVALNA